MCEYKFIKKIGRNEEIEARRGGSSRGACDEGGIQLPPNDSESELLLFNVI